MKKSLLFFLLFLLVAIFPHSTWAKIQTQTVSYSFGGATMKGHLAWDDSVQGKRPGILVIHEFWGLNDYAKKRAEQLAGLGYVALAADMYGEGKVAEHPDEAKKLATEVRQNLPVALGRANAALEVLRKNPLVDGTKLVAIGYCFGGAVALELAYSGADLAAVASFHGSLPVPESTKNIKAKIFIAHGEKDGFISPETIQKVKAALDQGKVSYQFKVYPNAVHGFTVEGSEKRGIPGVGYNAEADRQSWQDFLTFLKEAFN